MFRPMLSAYRREGHAKTFGELFDVVEQLDAVYEAFWQVNRGQGGI